MCHILVNCITAGKMSSGQIKIQWESLFKDLGLYSSSFLEFSYKATQIFGARIFSKNNIVLNAWDALDL